MTQPWFRLYRGLVNNAKAQRLSPSLFKAWVNLLCCTGDDGLLPPIADLAFTLRTTSKQVAGWLASLTSERMLIEIGGQFRANDWENHQCKSDTSNERVAAKRARDRAAHLANGGNPTDFTQGNATGEIGCNVTSNAPEQSRTDTETEREGARTLPRPRSKAGSRLPNDFTPADLAVGSDAADNARKLGEVGVRRELNRFRDHWTSATGKSAVKLEWNSAWRTWLSRAIEFAPQQRGKLPLHSDDGEYFRKVAERYAPSSGSRA